jgi:hypothetical protein
MEEEEDVRDEGTAAREGPAPEGGGEKGRSAR